jgi:hypothetical protein
MSSQSEDLAKKSVCSPKKSEPKRATLLAEITLASLLATTACGSGGSHSSSPPAPPVVQPPTHTVVLKWTDINGTNLNGYNVYRADHSASCQAFKKINDVLVASTTFTDAAVQNGSSYCYAATAVNNEGAESALSQFAYVTIPAN